MTNENEIIVTVKGIGINRCSKLTGSPAAEVLNQVFLHGEIIKTKDEHTKESSRLGVGGWGCKI